MKKINIVDLAVVLLVIVCIIGIVVRFTASDQTATKTMEYQIKISDIRQYSVTALQKKGTVYDSALQKKIGEIKEVSVTPSEKMVSLASGESVIVSVPERYDVVLTVQTKGTVSDTAYFSEANTELCVGGDYSICGQWYQCSGNIICVNVVE